jgi:hypothetical protein
MPSLRRSGPLIPQRRRKLNALHAPAAAWRMRMQRRNCAVTEDTNWSGVRSVSEAAFQASNNVEPFKAPA